MARLSYARVPMCRDRHLYIQNAVPRKRAGDGCRAFVNRERVCGRLRNFAVISRCVFARLTNRRPARDEAGSRNSRPLSGDRDQDRETLFLLSITIFPRPCSILTREPHYFTRPFFLSRVLTLSFIIILAHQRSNLLSIRPVSPLTREERYCGLVPLFEHLHVLFVRFS